MTDAMAEFDRIAAREAARRPPVKPPSLAYYPTIEPREPIPANGSAIRAFRASELPPPVRTRWLCVGWIPQAGTTVLVGDEGIGKSLWWVLLAAHVTTGRPLPAIGLPTRPPAAVLLIITEDSRDEVVSRLELAGADLSMVFFASEDAELATIPIVPGDMPAIEGLVRKHLAALVVCDGWLDTVPPRIKVKDPQGAREALRPWREMTAGTGTAALLLAHTNRLGSEHSLRDKVGVTAELRKAARMLLYAAVENDDDIGHRLYLGPDKANTTARRNAVRFRIESIHVRDRSEDDDGTTAKLTAAGAEAVTIGKLTGQWHTEQAAALQAAARGPSAAERAEAWLLNQLTAATDRALPVADVQAKAKAEGIGEKALRAARQSIGVTSAASEAGGMWWYALPQ